MSKLIVLVLVLQSSNMSLGLPVNGVFNSKTVQWFDDQAASDSHEDTQDFFRPEDNLVESEEVEGRQASE